MRPITHFMWGYQHIFRTSVNSNIKSALQAIGAGVGPSVILVGFRADDNAPFPYCIEPEHEQIGSTNLDGVAALAEQLYQQHEDASTFNTDPGVHAARHAALRDQARARALCETLEASPAGQGRTFFASGSRPVGGYEVHTVISVVTSRWDELPALTTRRRSRFDLVPSLPEAVVNAVLSATQRALNHREPPQMLSLAQPGETQDTVRTAAHAFLRSVEVLAGQWFAESLYDDLDAVAAQPYEGRTGVGTIVLASRKKDGAIDGVDVDIAFHNPVEVHQTRSFRKVLEMSGPDLHVLSDGEHVYGLGREADDYDPSTEQVFALTIVGRGSWQLTHAGVPLMRVDNTRPVLPREPLSNDRFADVVTRLFPETNSSEVAALWALAEGAAAQEHGTMLVVHHDAAAEAQRLVPQAIVIDPVPLADDALRAMTNIDGAVLVSPDAKCHAVGVILDGRATGTGDAGRGARYNSAVRYRAAAGDDCLVIIVSEDGMIDLLPMLKPRVNRDRVERAVSELVQASQGDDVNFERFHRRDEHLNTLSFYLNAEQCQRVNAAREAVDNLRDTMSGMRILRTPLTPNTEMNDSYFL